MDNAQIAESLSELADLLEIRGANPFRVRAYRNAVRTIQGLTRSLSDMLQGGEDLTELPGIGEDMAAHIQELLETGDLELLEETAREVPRSLTTLVRLEGLGPKKVKKLWEELDITEIGALEAALHDGRVEALEGFGKKSVEKTLRSIRSFRERQGRFLRTEAARHMEPLLAHMERAPGVERLEVAGSYRRGCETVGDADILALVDSGADARRVVMEHFTGYSDVEQVSMAGDTRGSVVLASGFPVDLRVLSRASYGAALHYFTGSKEHNVEIRRLAGDRNLRVNEYGVFRVKEDHDNGGSGDGADGGAGEEELGERMAGESEEELFRVLDLPWIPPTLREGRGEIEAARKGALPAQVERSHIRGDLHMHSTWSDGRNSIREMAEACRDRGYEYMAVTDHSQAVRVANGLTPDRVRAQWEEIEEVREEVEGIRVLRGLEVDILKDGSLDMPDEVLEDLDLVLVAVHSHMNMGSPAMTDRIIRALEHPATHILVHPTGRLLNRRDPYAVEVDAVLEAAADLGVAVELNVNPYRLDLRDVHLRRAKELGVPVSVATDAHRVGHLEYMDDGLLQAQRGWLEEADVLNALPYSDLQRRLRGSSE